MIAARGNRRCVRSVRRDIGLTPSVVAPANDRAIARKARLCQVPAANRDHAGRGPGARGLPGVVGAPSYHRSSAAIAKL